VSVLIVSSRNYDDYASEWEVKGADALRVGRALNVPLPQGVVVTCRVTFSIEGLTSDAIDENFERAREAHAKHDAQLDWVSSEGG